jgi:hypothetical protein
MPGAQSRLPGFAAAIAQRSARSATARGGQAAERSGADRGPGGAQRARAYGPGRARRAWPWSWPSCPPSWPSAGRPRLVWWVPRQYALHVVASQHQEHRVEETAGVCEVLEGDVEVGVLLVQQAYEAVEGVQDLTPATTDASFSDSTGAPSASRPRSARLYSRSAYSSVITPPTSNGSSDFSVWRRPAGVWLPHNRHVTLSVVGDTVRAMRIGCGRVSTRDQHPEAQHDALTGADGSRAADSSCPDPARPVRQRTRA